MKKLLIYLLLLIPFCGYSQTIINAAGQQQSASRTNTVITQRLSNKGGYYGIVPDTATRNLIPAFKRDTGFRVTVLRSGIDTIDYIWPFGQTLVGNWVRLSQGKTYTASHGATLIGTDIQTDSTYFPRGFTLVLTSLTHDTTYSNPSLTSRTFTLFQNGINRYLLPTEYRVRTGGGFDLFNPLLAGDEIILATTSYIAPSTNSVQVATYAAMLALGTPTNVLYVRVLNDENIGGTNTRYIKYPDGTILFDN